MAANASAKIQQNVAFTVYTFLALPISFSISPTVAGRFHFCRVTGVNAGRVFPRETLAVQNYTRDGRLQGVPYEFLAIAIILGLLYQSIFYNTGFKLLYVDTDWNGYEQLYCD